MPKPKPFNTGRMPSPAHEAEFGPLAEIPGSLEKKATGRNLGETPKSKIAQSEMAGAPRQTLSEELSQGDPELASALEQGQLEASRRLSERRVTTGSAPEGTSERRQIDRRQGIQEIKRLKGEIAADTARQANPAGRDTLVRNVPKIKERIGNLQKGLIESAPGPTVGESLGESVSSLSKLAKGTGRTLGVAGLALNGVEHWRASNAINTEENKDAPWIDKFAAYSERMLGMPSGSTGRQALPSETRAAGQL